MEPTVKSRLALIATALVGACAGNPPNDGPYAVFEPGDYSAVRKEIPVQISAIDGESPMTGRVRETVKPGKRVVDLYLPTRVGPHSSQARQIVVEAQPCTRYRIVAYYDNLVHVEWQPVVYDEPIGECRSQFGRAL